LLDVEAFLASLPDFKPRPGDKFGLQRVAEYFGQTKQPESA
jgi:hypothetical protein